MRESSLQKEVIKLLRSQDCYVIKHSANRFTGKGYPDIIFNWCGLFCAIELKRPDGGKVEKIQAANVRAINAGGGMAEICSNMEQVKQFLFKVKGRAMMLELWD